MNKLRNNPNVRLGLSLATIIFGTGAIGLSACTSGEGRPAPTTSPSASGASPEETPFNPRCAVEVTSAKGKKVNFRVHGEELSEPALYGVESTAFDFGDGKAGEENDLTEDHTYSRAGTYLVKAWATLEVAPGTEAHALPVRNGQEIACTPTVVTIR